MVDVWKAESPELYARFFDILRPIKPNEERLVPPLSADLMDRLDFLNDSQLLVQILTAVCFSMGWQASRFEVSYHFNIEGQALSSAFRAFVLSPSRACITDSTSGAIVW
jgi:hypothetical protein